jgi:tetratricopeptide (TPR) repeat protein
MKINLRILKALPILFLCFSLFTSSTAQTPDEQLPEIIKKIKPSVVTVLTYNAEGKLLNLGTGFFVSLAGDIITNRHVILNADRAEIRTSQGKTYPITGVVAEDIESDLIRVSTDTPVKEIKPVQLSTTLPKVGERIIVIGNPLGLEHTVSDGIVSSIREVPDFGNVIQITAPISQGSSGSPVLNMKGEVIGVATFQIIEGQNINFAISSENIIKLKPGKPKTFTEWKNNITNAEDLFDWLTSSEGLFYTGLLFFLSNDYHKALSYFERVIEKNPNYADAYFYIGYCKRKLGNYTEAVEAYKQAIRIKPDYADAYCDLGVVYGELGRYTEAIEAFKQAIRVNPDYADAYYNLGVVYGELGRYAEAIEAFKQVIRIKPDYAEAYLNLGVAYGELGRYAEAIEAYKQAIRVNPDYAKAYYNLGVAYRKLGRNTEAIEAYKQAIRINPDYANAYYNLGVVYGELGRYTEAIEAFKQAIRVNPDYADAYYNLGVAYRKLGRNTEAIEAYKQAIRINPDFAEAHYNLGIAYLILGNKSSALEQYKILKNLDVDLANRLFDLIFK